MRITIFLQLFLLVCSFVPALAQDSFLADFKIKWKNAAAYTLEIARTMPEEYYEYTPTPVEMTFRKQLKHMAGNMVWLSSSYLDGGADHVDPSKAGEGKKEIVAILEKAFVYTNATIDGQTEKISTVQWISLPVN